MAEILSGFASISRLVMMYPRSLRQGTPKVHFSGFSLMLKSPEVGEGFFQVEDEAIALLGFYDDVVNIDLQIVTDLSLKAGLHRLLVGGPHVL
jgi:hypothetical protein